MPYSRRRRVTYISFYRVFWLLQFNNEIWLPLLVLIALTLKLIARFFLFQI